MVLNITGFTALVTALFTLGGLVIAVIILIKGGKKGDVSTSGRMVGVALMALFVFMLFAGTAWRAVGGDLNKLIFG